LQQIFWLNLKHSQHLVWLQEEVIQTSQLKLCVELSITGFVLINQWFPNKTLIIKWGHLTKCCAILHVIIWWQFVILPYKLQKQIFENVHWDNINDTLWIEGTCSSTFYSFSVCGCNWVLSIFWLFKDYIYLCNIKA
jgi:hypothetical protein